MMLLRAPDAAGRDDAPLDGGALVTWPLAKVNLRLAVGALRPDGYHHVVTVLQAIDLADRLSVAAGGEGIELRVDGAELGPPEENLCFRAARAFLDETGWRRGVRMHLLKGIPAGAGLGGGSSDAAYALRSLNALAGRPLADAQLVEIGARLGSDVPFFLGASTLAIGRGRGERLEGLEPLPPAALVVAIPPVHVGTAGAYRALDARRAEGGAGPSDAPPEPVLGSWSEVARVARNDFEEVVARLHAPVADALAAVRASGADPGLLCGSGSAVFGRCESWSDAVRIATELREALGHAAVAVRTVQDFGGIARERPPNRAARAG